MGAVSPISAHFAPWIRLVSPFGAVVGIRSAGVAGVDTGALAISSGTYTVIVGSYLSGYFDGTGSYLLTLAQGPGAVVVSNGDEGGPMTNRNTKPRNTNHVHFAYCTFTSTKSDYIALSMGAVSPISAHFAPWIRLVSPSRSFFFNDTAATEIYTLSLHDALPISYTVIVGSYLSGYFDGTGSYLLTLAQGPGAVVVSNGDEGGPMTYGATYAGNIYQRDFDTWTFTATQGDYIALSMGAVSPISAHFAPWIRLVSPTGALLGNSSTGQSASHISAIPPPSRTDTPIVLSYLSGYFDGTRSYLLTLAEGPGAVVVSNGDEGVSMLNDTASAEIYSLSLHDALPISATQGDYIALSMGAVSPISAHFAPWIRLVSPTGALLGNSSTGQGASDIAATAPTSGTYTVIVGSYLSGYFDGTGSYLLTLAQGPGAVVVSNGEEGGPMTNGANAGSIYQGDFDTWTFTATQGDHITLSMGAVTPVSAHFAPWMRLVSPTGVLLANSSTGAATAQITVTAPTSGTYTVIVGSYLSWYYDCTGNYLLTLTR